MLDTKHREFYDELEEHEQKKFSPYVMLKYAASVEGDPDFQEWFLRATNERVNQDFFAVSTSRHKKLQWLLCTTASPGMGTMRHYWITTKKERRASTPAMKLLRALYPQKKTDELELLAQLNDIKDLQSHARLHGLDDQEIRRLTK